MGGAPPPPPPQKKKGAGKEEGKSGGVIFGDASSHLLRFLGGTVWGGSWGEEKLFRDSAGPADEPKEVWQGHSRYAGVPPPLSYHLHWHAFFREAFPNGGLAKTKKKKREEGVEEGTFWACVGRWGRRPPVLRHDGGVA